MPLVLYSNGILMFGGPFRPYSDPVTQVSNSSPVVYYVKQFFIECHETKTKQSQRPIRTKEDITRSLLERRVKTSKLVKRGKTRATKSRLVLVLHLIGWQGGANFLDQLESKIKQNQCNSWLLSSLNWKFKERLSILFLEVSCLLTCDIELCLFLC